MNEGLILQKKKTRILTSEEFQDTSAFLDLDTLDSDETTTSDETKLLRLSIRFDPYSETALEDYERLKKSLKKIDIVGILARELTKTAIDVAVAKQAIGAIRALDPEDQGEAVRTILDKDNLRVLSPIFCSLMRTLRGLYDDLEPDIQEIVDTALIDLFDRDSYMLKLPLHQAYYVQTIGRKSSRRKEEIMIELFDRAQGPLVRREIIATMANWDCAYWLTGLRRRFSDFSQWERRAFIIASYKLGDEGRHWRKHTKRNWSPVEHALALWTAKGK